jgi:hypothetical protein
MGLQNPECGFDSCRPCQQVHESSDLSACKKLMGIPYLKISAEESYQILDNLVVEGNRIRDGIITAYGHFGQNPDAVPQTEIKNWQKEANDWCMKTINKLTTVFVSESDLYEFRDAQPPFGASSANPDYVTVIRKMKARLDKLVGFRNTIRDRFEVNLEIVGGHKITQIGADNQANIGE